MIWFQIGVTGHSVPGTQDVARHGRPRHGGRQVQYGAEQGLHGQFGRALSLFPANEGVCERLGRMSQRKGGSTNCLPSLCYLIGVLSSVFHVAFSLDSLYTQLSKH